MPYKDPAARKRYEKRRWAATKIAGLDRMPMARGKSTHVALMYLKSRRCPVHPNELIAFNRAMFSNDVHRPLGKLVDKGYAVKNIDGTYSVTKTGVGILYRIAAHSAN